MIMIVSDFYKDVLQAIKQAELQGELEYHLREYGCKPKKVYILPFFEAMDNNYKPTKNTMIVSI